MKNIKSFSKYLITGLSLLSIILSISIAFAYITQQDELKQEEPAAVAYTYTVTTIDFIGLYGHSKDNGGLFLTPDQIPSNQRITEGDTIKVYFPSEKDYETVLAVHKIN